MATSPAPDAAAPPGMCPGVAVLGGGGGSGGGSGDGSGDGDGSGGNGNGNGDGASGDGKDGGSACGDPVCPITGRMFLRIFDFGLGGPYPLRFTRAYSARASHCDGELGHGWNHTFGWQVRVRRRRIELHDGDARLQVFDAFAPGSARTTNDLGWELRRDGDTFVLRQPGTEETRRFTAPDGRDRLYYLASISDRNGNTIRVDRDGRGHLRTITDSVGRPIRFATDERGRLLQAFVPTEPTHQQWMEVARYTYDEEGNLASATDAEGYTARYVYENHLLVEHRTPSGLSYFYRYDGGDQRAYCVETWGEYPGAIDPALERPTPPQPASGRDTRRVKGIHYTRLTYDKAQRYTEVEDGIGGLTRFFGDEQSRSVKIVFPTGGVVERAFDPATGRLVSESDATGADRTIQQGPHGLPVGFGGPLGTEVKTEWTPEGDEIRTDRITGAVTVSRYDAHKNLVFMRHADGTTEEWWYDDRGCLGRYINRQGAVTSYVNDALGRCIRIIHPNGGVESREYDYLSRMTALVDAAGRRTEWTWDRRSEPVAKKLPNGTVVRAEYDANRKIVRLEEGSMTTLFEYGGMGWPCRVTRPGGDVWEYRWDVMGNLVAVRNGRGQTFRIERDHAGRVIAYVTFEGVRTEIGRDVVGDETYLDTALGRFAIERDAFHRITAVAAPDQSISFERGRTDALERVDNGVIPVKIGVDLLGRVVEDGQGPHRNAVSWTGGEVAGITSDVGVPIRYAYGTSGALSRIEAGRTAVRLGEPSGGDWITRLGDRLVLRRTFGENGRLARQTLARLNPLAPLHEAATPGDPNALLSIEYEYDDKLALRREWRSDGTTTEYDVDAGARITTKRVYRGVRLVREEHVDYDPAGSPRMRGARYDALARPIEIDGEALEYDVAGRLVRRSTDAGDWCYEWNSLDQLVRVRAPDHVVEMEYDARGRRMRKRLLRQNEIVSSTFYVWANDVVIHEVDELSGSSRTYLRPNNDWSLYGHVGLRGGREEATFYISNPVGGIDCAVDADGKIVWAAEQTIFGLATPTVRDIDVSARFPNQHDDPDVGLVYNRQRWYDPRLGQYVSPDPMLLEGTPNPRDYVENPLLFIDPLGTSSHPGLGTGAGDANFHPLPGDSSIAPPANVAGMDANYMARPGAWATAGTPTVPGYATCPAGALHLGSGFGTAQGVVNNAGNTYGCHSCGAKKSGHPTRGDDHWICDHQPPRCTYSASNSPTNHSQASSANVRLYPHCYNCSQLQAGRLNGSVPASQKHNLGQAGFLRNTTSP